MDPILVSIILKDIAAPEILNIIDWFHKRGQPPPTLEQIQTELDNRMAYIISRGQSFLDRTSTSTTGTTS